MRPFANGAPGMGADFRASPGRFTAIGRRVGILIRQKYALMFSMCFKTQRANGIRARVQNSTKEDSSTSNMSTRRILSASKVFALARSSSVGEGVISNRIAIDRASLGVVNARLARYNRGR